MDFDFEKALQHVSSVKLPGGVVGKVSMVLIVASVCLGGLAAVTRNEWVAGGAIAAIFLLAFPMLWRLISFADRNPQAALLEGAEFLLHQQILLGSKGHPSIPLEGEVLTEERPAELPPDEQALLNEAEEAPAFAAPEPEDPRER